VLEPLTFGDHDPTATLYVAMLNGRVFLLADPAQRWRNSDQFAENLLRNWIAEPCNAHCRF
jgi:hypothetical protein